MRRTFPIALAIAGLLLVSPLLTGCFATQARLANATDVSTDGIDSVNLVFDTDNVTIQQSSSDSIEVREFMGEDDPAYYDSIVTDGSTVTITQGQRPSSAYFATYAEIYLPESYTGALTITSGSGQVIVEGGNHLSSLSVQTSSGSISVSDMTVASLNATSTSGSVSIASISGPIVCSSTSGSISASSLSGYGEFSGTSGNINVDYKALSGNVSVQSGNGKVSLALPRTSSYRLTVTTQDGLITLPYSDGDARTTKTDTGYEVTFGLPTTRNTVQVTTASGAISIRYHK